MTESDLRIVFVNFLTTEKGYPNRSINFEIPIGDQISNRRFLDLAIIDPEEKEILAIVELHGNDNPAIVRKAFRRINEYKSIPPLLNKNVLGFVVVPSDDDFLIFRATYTEKNIGFINVSKNEFPSFSDLAFNAQIQDKINQDNKEFIIISNEKVKKRLANNAIYPVIVGTIVGIASLVVTFFMKPTDDKIKQNIEKSDSAQVAILIDDYFRDHFGTNSLSAGNDTLKIGNIKVDEKQLELRLYKNVEEKLHKGVEGRLKNIELMLSKEPEKTLSILEIKAQLSDIKSLIENRNNLYDEKITSLKEKTDLLSNLTWGLALTVLATIVAGLIAVYQAIKKT